MIRIITPLLLVLALLGCNPTLTTFKFIYNDEGPNQEIAQRMEQLLESTYYNTDIVLVKGLGTEQNLDSLMRGNADIGLVENYIKYRDGVNSAFSIYSEVLHIFYREDMEVESFADLMSDRIVYIGLPESPTYNMMMDLFDFYALDLSRIVVTSQMAQAEVIVELTNILDLNRLKQYKGYSLFSFEEVSEIGEASTLKGISLKYPRMTPFLIPQGTYIGFANRPIVTLSVDLVMMVRSDMGEIAVNDFTKTMLRNRQIFTSIDPLLYEGLQEDFDQGKLNIPLHEGARIFLSRDEPSFIERYAELGGVILSLVIAVWSGLVSLTKWQAQKKKDRIDEFYEDLIKTKNSIPSIRTLREAIEKIRLIQAAQNKAFELLISEELVANESFRIYMELSKETINELRSKVRALKKMQTQSIS